MKTLSFNLERDTEQKLEKILGMYTDEDVLIWAGIYEMFIENKRKLSEILLEIYNLNFRNSD